MGFRSAAAKKEEGNYAHDAALEGMVEAKKAHKKARTAAGFDGGAEI